VVPDDFVHNSIGDTILIPSAIVIGKLIREPRESGPYFKIEGCIASETWTVCLNPHQRVAGYLEASKSLRRWDGFLGKSLGDFARPPREYKIEGAHPHCPFRPQKFVRC